MNKLELCQDLRRECGASGTGPVSVENQTGEMLRIIKWFDKAYLDICNRWFNWKFLWQQKQIAIHQGISTYSEEGVGIWDHRTFYLDGNALTVIEYEVTVAEGWQSDLNQQEPDTVVIMPNGELVLSPVPDKNYTLKVDCFIEAAKLNANESTPLIPTRFHEVIIARAMIYYGSWESAPEIKQEGLERYSIALKKLEDHQLPDNNYASSVNTGGGDIVVRSE